MCPKMSYFMSSFFHLISVLGVGVSFPLRSPVVCFIGRWVLQASLRFSSLSVQRGGSSQTSWMYSELLPRSCLVSNFRTLGMKTHESWWKTVVCQYPVLLWVHILRIIQVCTVQFWWLCENPQLQIKPHNRSRIKALSACLSTGWSSQSVNYVKVVTTKGFTSSAAAPRTMTNTSCRLWLE